MRQPWQMRCHIRRLYSWQEGSDVQECDAMHDYDEEDSIAKQAYEDEHGVSLRELEEDRMCMEDTQRAAAEKEAGFQKMLRGVNHFWFWRLAVEHDFVDELLEQHDELEQPPSRAGKRRLPGYDSD
jgi:hypothetical protein